jgi:hypothetical protein
MLASWRIRIVPDDIVRHVPTAKGSVQHEHPRPAHRRWHVRGSWPPRGSCASDVMVVEGPPDASGAGGPDSLVDRQSLAERFVAFSASAIAEMTSADAFQSACFLGTALHGYGDLTRRGQRTGRPPAARRASWRSARRWRRPAPRASRWPVRCRGRRRNDEVWPASVIDGFLEPGPGRSITARSE